MAIWFVRFKTRGTTSREFFRLDVRKGCRNRRISQSGAIDCSCGNSCPAWQARTAKRDRESVRRRYRILGIDPSLFWRTCRGKTFLDLPEKPLGVVTEQDIRSLPRKARQMPLFRMGPRTREDFRSQVTSEIPFEQAETPLDEGSP